MPSKKKRKVELAKDDGSGLPLKWRFVDDSVAAKAQRKQQRYIQQADETEAAAKLAAQREKASAGKVGLAQTDPDHEGVEFDITLDSSRRTRSSMKKPPVNPSPLHAAQQERASAGKVDLAQTSPDHEGVEFDITLDSGRRTRASMKKSPLNPSPSLASSSKSSPVGSLPRTTAYGCFLICERRDPGFGNDDHGRSLVASMAAGDWPSDDAAWRGKAVGDRRHVFR